MCASRPGKKVKRAQFTCHRAISVTVPWQSRIAYRTHQNGKEQKGTKSNDNRTKSNDIEFTETLEHLLKLCTHFTETFKSLVNLFLMRYCCRSNVGLLLSGGFRRDHFADSMMYLNYDRLDSINSVDIHLRDEVEICF